MEQRNWSNGSCWSRKEIENGEAKVIIATHAVFSDKTKFFDLGLLIIDEEQHFGVKQKEKLKKLTLHAYLAQLGFS